MGGAAVYAQDKYSLTSPSGIAFSDFKGYEDWAVVSSARTDEVLKVIVANPTMIEAYKAGIPNNGQSFPDGSKIVKLQWKPKRSTEAPFVVDVPDVFTQAFVIEKDSKKFPQSGGWGYALFNYDAASGNFAADPSPSDCGHACHVAVKAKTTSSTRTRSVDGARPHSDAVVSTEASSAIRTVTVIPRNAGHRLTVLNGFSNRERASWTACCSRACTANVYAMVRSRYRNATGDRNQLS